MVLDLTKVMYNLIKIYVGIDSFHAYGSSGISSQIELTRTHYQRSVQRIKHLISIYTNNTTIYPFVYYISLKKILSKYKIIYNTPQTFIIQYSNPYSA